MSDAVLLAIVGLVGTFFGMLGGVVAASLSYKAQKPLSEGNASLANTQANLALIEPLTGRINELERDVEAEREARRNSILELRTQFDTLLRGSWENYEQLIENKITPRYKPPREFKTGPLNKVSA
jgi:hypothetical protein